jgi:hypothetical protein
LTFNFYYSSTCGGGKTFNIGNKAFNHLNDRPVESLEILGFGEIEYIKTGGRWSNVKKRRSFHNIKRNARLFSVY